MVEQLLAAQRELAAQPVDWILERLERVAQRWLDREDPIRREAEERLAAATGLAPAMLRIGIDQMIRRMQGIPDLLDADLGSRQALDSLVQRAPEVKSQAWGPGLLVCIFAGNVPGIPAFDMAMGLALKSAVLCRPASGEPLFAELFARSLAEVDELLGRCVAVQRWGHDETWPYDRAGAVVAYGSDESVAAVRRNVPDHVRFVGHGHKLSFAVVAREAATPDTARRLALDVAMYDQQGCVSPHMAFVERGGALSPAEFARTCGEALAGLEAEMPRAKLTQAEAMALRAVRDEAEFTADSVHASQGDLAWAVVHSETPAFLPSPLNRLLRTYAVDDLAQVAEVVKPYAAYLQTVGYAAPAGRVAEVAGSLGALGASRLAPIGQMQEPGALWRHDGGLTAGALVRWIDVEVM